MFIKFLKAGYVVTQLWSYLDDLKDESSHQIVVCNSRSWGQKSETGNISRMAKNDSKKRQDKNQEQKERGKDVNQQHRKDPRT